jgi:hypothetical protein
MKWKCEYVVRWTPTVNRRDWVSERVLRFHKQNGDQLVFEYDDRQTRKEH